MALSELTVLGSPKLMVVVPAGLVPRFVGKPVPLQVTGGPRVQPPICRLAALTGTPPACKSWIALTRLLAQSPVVMKVQPEPPAGVANPTVAGVEIVPMLPTE